MNWVTTNIRFPEDVYMELKMEAVNRRKSIAAIIRERIEIKDRSENINTAKMLKRLDRLARENDRQNPGISFSEKLIEMRYEQ